MGVIFDSTCVLWQDDCGSQGSCMFNDNSRLSLGFLLLCFSVSCISLAAMIVAVVCYRPPVSIDSVVLKVNGAGDATEVSRRTQ